MLLKAYLNGQANAPHRRGTVITVTADTVQCRVSNVDITSASCDIGLYACSPIGENFQCRFTMLEISENTWA